MDSGNRVRKFVVPEVVYGAEAHQMVGRYAAGFALRTVLVVSDPGVEAVGWTDAICDRLSLAGIEPVRFCDTTSNPKDHVVRFNFPAAPKRYRTLAHALGLPVHGKTDREACETLVAGLARFKQSLGIGDQVTTHNLTREQISRLAARAMQDACMVTNPRQPTQKDIEGIYAAAL